MSGRFTVVKKGYDTKEVDAHIDKLEKELKEYQNRETAISKSLINAEVKASDIMQEAEKKASLVMDGVREQIIGELEAIEKMIASERKALDDFCKEYDTIVKYYFTGNASDIISPLREKINLLEAIAGEIRRGEGAFGEPDGEPPALGDTLETAD